MGLRPKAAHVRVERFSPGDREKYGSQDHESAQTILGEEMESVEGIYGNQDAGLGDDSYRAEGTDGEEPDQDEGAKEGANTRGAVALDQKDACKNGDGNGHHIGFE